MSTGSGAIEETGYLFNSSVMEAKRTMQQDKPTKERSVPKEVAFFIALHGSYLPIQKINSTRCATTEKKLNQMAIGRSSTQLPYTHRQYKQNVFHH